MNLKSLGYRTDLIFPSFDGEILDRGDYLVIRSPTNPTFYWGNYLLFSQPPREGDYTKWRELFVQEIGAPPQVEHQTYGWDSPEGEEGEIQPFLQAGFSLNRGIVMRSTDLPHPTRPPAQVNVRALMNEADWAEALDNQVICRDEAFEERAYREFQARQMDRYREMAASGLGDWYGAFIDTRLVADLGIFHDGYLGRFQSVETHPGFRRRGIAGTLIAEASRLAKTRYGIDILVIVADEGSGAARLYESLGFQPVEVQVGLELRSKIDLQTPDGG
jgi:ribosomal protein S18 acetylase RimI-like enzyme